ncbi:MAG: V-type ATP synthase subunit F [Thermoplasmata archaeon]|nr:MAG: V-type ATP synthase subunit F [Thermoplasmata archaeon]
MKLIGFCDRDTAVALRLAGLTEVYTPEGNNEKDIWFDLTDRDDIGVIFITEKIAEALDKYLRDFRIRNNIPIIVEIPDKHGRRKDHVDFVSHLIKKAVGIEVSKK